MRLYRYVGSLDLQKQAITAPPGTPIRCARDLELWIRADRPSVMSDGSVIATFVVDATGLLRVADRHREHISLCPEPVQAAGELTVRPTSRGWVVESVSNQSTGYCPEPESFEAVKEALSAAGLAVPPSFDPECIFRRCPACGTKNIVKCGVFECACGAELPAHWNLGG